MTRVATSSFLLSSKLPATFDRFHAPRLHEDVLMEDSGGMARVCDWNYDGRDEIVLLGGEGYVDLRVYAARSESAGPSCNRARATEVAR